jgi:hypothetical protein
MRSAIAVILSLAIASTNAFAPAPTFRSVSRFEDMLDCIMLPEMIHVFCIYRILDSDVK